MNWPKLPPRAAYLVLNNARRRNALSLAVLQDLKRQLQAYNTSRTTGRLLTLPPFQPGLLDDLERCSRNPNAPDPLTWLVDAETWRREREGLPSVLVLRSDGPVFSSGHDLAELRTLSHDEVKETFALCANVMGLIRRSPAPVVGAVQGLATAAGCQLALTTDLPVARASTPFRLPGASIGLPCTSPAIAVDRRLGPAFTYRMLALAEAVRADELPGGTVDVVRDEEAFERRVGEVVRRLAETAGQPQALGKWAYWTQHGLTAEGDGYEEAVAWAGRVMALHARAEDAREGIASFFEKRPPEWKT